MPVSMYLRYRPSSLAWNFVCELHNRMLLLGILSLQMGVAVNAQDNSFFANSEPGSPVRRPVCKECASPLSDSSEFCWMCGASRDSENDPRVHLIRTTPDCVKPAQSGSTDESPALGGNSVQRETEPYWPGSLQDVPLPDRVHDPQETSRPGEAQLFEFAYRQKSSPEFDLAKSDGSKRKLFQSIALLVLFALVVTLGYWQRNNAKALYGMLKNMVSEEVSSYWQEDTQAKSPRLENTPTIRTRTRQHVRSTEMRPVTAAAEVNTGVDRADSLPLGVRVRGQAMRGLTPVSGTDANYNSHGAVEVGIADPWITSARLSPIAIQISPRESLALLIKRVPPLYPEAARIAKLQGSVVLKLVIHKDGTVGDLKPLSGDPMLIPAAIDCVRKWVYRPYYLYGVPMDVETIVVVDFTLASQVAQTTAPY